MKMYEIVGIAGTKKKPKTVTVLIMAAGPQTAAAIAKKYHKITTVVSAAAYKW